MLNINKSVDCQIKFIEILKKTHSVCLTTHINPDGDGLCACLALKRILFHLGIKADIVVDDTNLERYEFLQAMQNVMTNNQNLQYETVVVIDLHDYQRLGNREHLIRKAKTVFVIDHHEIKNDMIECDCCWVEPEAVCTGWMVYEMFGSVIDKMTIDDKLYVGKCLYTTLLNDTNNFTNANTGITAFELSKVLCQYGVKPNEIYRLYMSSRTPMEMRLLGQVFTTIELYDNGHILMLDSSQEMLKENGLDSEAISNLTRWVQDLKGVDSVVYFREEDINTYRLSLRSKTVNVHSIASKYGGGGHLQASGCTIRGNLSELKSIILTELHQAERIK